MEPGELLRVAEIARGLGVDADTVYRWISSGELAAINLGSAACPRWRVRRRDLDALLERRATRGSPARNRAAS